MAQFFEVRFPAEYSWGASGGPTWNTGLVTTDSGREASVEMWSEPRVSYKLARDLFSWADHDRMLAFWRLYGGKARGFRFKDWHDFRATAQNIGTGTGALTTFQLRKNYGFTCPITGNGNAVWRKITKPVPGTVKVYVAGVLRAIGWTVNTATGVVTFTTGTPTAGQAVTADFEFDVPVRFDADDLQNVLDKNFNLYAWQNIAIREYLL